MMLSFLLRLLHLLVIFGNLELLAVQFVFYNLWNVHFLGLCSISVRVNLRFESATSLTWNFLQ